MGSAAVPLQKAVPVLRVKPGCAFGTIAPGGFRILAAIDNATKILGVDLTITAGTNDHPTGRHATGEAFDLSLKTLTVPQIVKLKTYLEQALGPRFTVLIEAPSLPSDALLAGLVYVNADATGLHCHIQVRKGDVYPPTIPATVAI